MNFFLLCYYIHYFRFVSLGFVFPFSLKTTIEFGETLTIICGKSTFPWRTSSIIWTIWILFSVKSLNKFSTCCRYTDFKNDFVWFCRFGKSNVFLFLFSYVQLSSLKFESKKLSTFLFPNNIHVGFVSFFCFLNWNFSKFLADFGKYRVFFLCFCYCFCTLLFISVVSLLFPFFSPKSFKLQIFFSSFNFLTNARKAHGFLN